MHTKRAGEGKRASLHFNSPTHTNMIQPNPSAQPAQQPSMYAQPTWLLIIFQKSNELHLYIYHAYTLYCLHMLISA